jgi:NAD-dependent deacetylase
VVALTGAGISTESGIPDYRGPGGVWEKGTPPTIGDFLENPDTRRDYWEQRVSGYPKLAAAEPNEGHRALARLEQQGRLAVIVTQNIDGLHQKAGNRPERVVELHGSAHWVRCLVCLARFSSAAILDRQLGGELVPSCEQCGGPMRSATVLFGEPLPPEALQQALEAARTCDLLLVIGSSLVVNPAARLPAIAKTYGAAVAIINRTTTPYDHLADVHLLGEAGPTLVRLIQDVSAA